MADFHSKMSVCRQELGGGGSTPSKPPTIPTMFLADCTNGRAYATVLRPSVVVCRRRL